MCQEEAIFIRFLSFHIAPPCPVIYSDVELFLYFSTDIISRSMRKIDQTITHFYRKSMIASIKNLRLASQLLPSCDYVLISLDAHDRKFPFH